MTLLSTLTASRSNANLWLAAVYAGVITGIIALAMILLINVPVLWVVAGLLIGAGPVLGYDLARGQLGASWKPVIGGIIGTILFVLGLVPLFVPIAAIAVPILVVVAGLLSVILWPIVVGAMSPNQSIGRLLLGSLLGLVIGLVVVLAVVAPIMGQNPSWIGTGMVVFWAVWGGTCGAIMAGWSK